MKPMIGVIGASNPTAQQFDQAVKVGSLLAKKGILLVCGGLGGVMEGACKGAVEAGGFTIGILPDNNPDSANPYVKIAIPTGIGQARNRIIINTCAAFIAIAGGYGTLSEIAFALDSGKTVIGLETWDIEGIKKAENPEQAVELVMKAIGR